MPLPAALAARLAKRGLIKVEEPPKKVGDVEEEVFAEDYDDLGASAPQQTTQVDSEDSKQIESREEDPNAPVVYEVSACPNKWNTFHECVEFCEKHWGKKKFKSDPVNDRKRNRMLRKYPLPEGWREVADPTTGRFYYWNQLTDQVSWLAPHHPRAVLHISKPLQELATSFGGSMSGDDEPVEEEEQMDVDDDMADKDFEEIEREVMQERRQRERERGRDRGRDGDRRRDRGRGREKDDLDPMDPAAYSDIPRGNWSSGLETRGVAKTGVDVTASGPLFQQRPYPSPGAVLRANKQLTDDDDDD